MKRLLFTFYLSLLLFQGWSQTNQKKISGRILGSDGVPVEFASVYINNTSAFSLSDTTGYFELKIPAHLTDFVLIISRIGFDEKRISYKGITKSIRENIRLQENKALKEVTVKARQDPMWRKRWNIFKKALLGESSFVNNCIIENPEDVELSAGENKEIFAVTTAPLRITNLALGYRIIISIDGFKTDGRTTSFIDNKYFIPIAPKDEKESAKWAKNRLAAYKNSFRHFLVSMIENPDDERFDVYYSLEIRKNYLYKIHLSDEVNRKDLFYTDKHAFVRANSDSTEFYFGSKLPLLILLKDRYYKNSPYVDAPYQFSQMVIPRRFIAFNRYGWINRPNGLVLHDYWGREGVADMLPYNYHPEDKINLGDHEEQSIAPIEEIENKGFMKDSTIFYIPSEISYVRPAQAQPELADNKPDHGSALYTPDYLVSSRVLEKSNSMFELLRSIPGLTIENNSATNDNTIYFRENSTARGSGKNPCLILNGQVTCNPETMFLVLNTIDVRTIRRMGAIRYGNSAALGSKGANGAIIIDLKK